MFPPIVMRVMRSLREVAGARRRHRGDFAQPGPIDREMALSAFANGDPPAISEALVSAALHDPDREWAEEQCLRLSEHDDAGVRGTAGLCLGHVARRFGAIRPESREAVRRLCDDPMVDNGPCDAIDDIEMFVKPE